MLPFEHIKKSANPVHHAATTNTTSPNKNKRATSPGHHNQDEAAATTTQHQQQQQNRSGAIRPHSRSSAIPFTSPHGGHPQSRSSHTANRPQARTPISSSSSIFNTTINTTSASGSASAITSPMKPSSARRRMMSNTANSGTRKSSPSTRRGLFDTHHHSRSNARRRDMFGNNNNNDDNANGISPNDVIPDFQLCVNYKKVDITVNDAKQHLSVRPPNIRAATTVIDCDLEPFEFPHLFSVACGLEDVGVDHSVLFFVVAANPECFTVAPTVDCEGTLRFQASPPAPGSVHLEKTTLHVTAWDALSLTGSGIVDHADEVEELEEGVPFCDPIKLEVTFTHAAVHNNNNNTSTTSKQRSRSSSPTSPPSSHQQHSSHLQLSNISASTPSTALLGLSPNKKRNQNNNNDVGDAGDADMEQEEEEYEPNSFPRLNPNLLRDPFIVLGNTLQSRVVQAVTCPVTDTELLSLNYVRHLFVDTLFIATDTADREKLFTTVSQNDEQSLRQAVTKLGTTSATTTDQEEDEEEQLCSALEALGFYVLENGSSLGETTAVEVFEKLVNIRRRQQQTTTSSSNQQQQQPKLLLRAFNMLAAAEVAIGNFSEASTTLERGFRLCQDEEMKEKNRSHNNDYVSPIRDEEAVWCTARRVYVLLVRGETEEALKLLKHPSLAEVDTVFADDVPLRVIVQVFTACAKCALGRYGESIRKLRQVFKQFQQLNSNQQPQNEQDQQQEESSEGVNNIIPEITILQTLILTCIRTGDITQARDLLTTIVEEYEVNQTIPRGVTCVLANMASVYTELPTDLVDSLASVGATTTTSKTSTTTTTMSKTILRTPSIVLRAVDAWQALMLDPHSTKHREFISTYISGTAPPSDDIMSNKLKVLDAAVSVATSSAAVSGNVEKQRKTVQHVLMNKLSVELQPYHWDVIGACELLAWIHLCSSGTSDDGAVAAAATTAVSVGESALRDLRAHGVDVFDQAPRLAQLLGQANGILNNLSSQSVLASTHETLDDATMRYGEGTRALFAPLVDRAIAEINSNQFPAALEKLHKALKIVDSGNAIFLLGPLFRPAAQLTPEELNERARLSKGRVDTRAASDFALILFAMASVAEAENRLFDAETLLLQVLAALELAGIEDSICTAAVYRSMSQLLFEDGHYGDALAYVERAEKLLHTKFPYATSLKKQVEQTQQYIEFKIRASGYSLKRISDTRFRFAVFV